MIGFKEKLKYAGSVPFLCGYADSLHRVAAKYFEVNIKAQGHVKDIVFKFIFLLNQLLIFSAWILNLIGIILLHTIIHVLLLQINPIYVAHCKKYFVPRKEIVIEWNVNAMSS